MRKKIVLLLLCLLLALPGRSLAADDSKHWVYPQFKDYKQLIVPYKGNSSVKGPITREEWIAFTNSVLDPAQWDEPILINNWSTMLKMGIELPWGKEDFFLNDTVYNEVSMYAKHISRETAVGGVIKLMSLSILRASWDNPQIDAAKVFSDFSETDEKYTGLVRVAYCENLLDNADPLRFRPKDMLTNAEAISIMDKVMNKYERVDPLLRLPPEHWAATELKLLHDGHYFTRSMQQRLQAALTGDTPIQVELWRDAVEAVLRTTPSQTSAYWNKAVDPANSLTRDQALADVIGLAWPNRKVNEKERQEAALAFADYAESADPMTLAAAYSLGIIKGDGTEYEPRRQLTCAEAMVLLSRVAATLNGR